MRSIDSRDDSRGVRHPDEIVYLPRDRLLFAQSRDIVICLHRDLFGKILYFSVDIPSADIFYERIGKMKNHRRS